MKAAHEHTPAQCECHCKKLKKDVVRLNDEVDRSIMDEQESEKRAVKMTEKAVEDHKARQLQACRYKLSQLTSMVKQIEQLMEDDANADTVI